MADIRVLDKAVSEQIAAGEVIEQPASVVKELVENAVDAGAKSVTVEIRRGGVAYIRVTDDGSGIAPEQVATAFLRHATSKVRTEDDLSAIHTLGFRGEALASVAAVARVEMLTKTRSSDFGTRYVIEGGMEQEQEAAGCPDGTTIVIRDLFFNTPARLKFLKKDASEGNAVAAIVDRIALSHPEVSFRFLRDNEALLHTPGDGQAYSAIYAVCGKQFAASLIPADYESGGLRVSGFVQRPMFARGNRAMQHFFLNGRYIKSRVLTAALEQAYKNAVMVGRFPSCVLNLEIPADTVDVNVHPTKTEVRFANEKVAFDCVYFGVKNALLLGDGAKEMELSPAREPEAAVPAAPATAPAFSVPAVQAPVRIMEAAPAGEQLRLASGVTAYRTEEQQAAPPSSPDEPFRYLDASAFIKREAPAVADAPVDPVPAPQEDRAPLRVLGEAFGTYIVAVAEGTDELVLIDKHAAHERIQFERIRTRSSMERQLLLSPLTLSVSREEEGVLLANTETLLELGFAVESFGAGVLAVREVPSMLDKEDAGALVAEIAEKLLRSKSDLSPQVVDDLYASMACKAAIRAGDKTSLPELAALAEQVWGSETLRYCPHGRPTVMTLTRKKIEKEFGRV